MEITTLKPEQLVTNRLILRRSVQSDVETLFDNYFSNRESAIFLARKPHDHFDQTEKVLNDWCNFPWSLETPIKFGWVISLSFSDEPIGVFLVELNNSEAQIHFGISNKYLRQGFATEAGIAAYNWLKAQNSISKVWTICDLENIASAKVLEKIGLQNVGVKKGAFISPFFDGTARDCFLYRSEEY